MGILLQNELGNREAVHPVQLERKRARAASREREREVGEGEGRGKRSSHVGCIADYFVFLAVFETYDTIRTAY